MPRGNSWAPSVRLASLNEKGDGLKKDLQGARRLYLTEKNNGGEFTRDGKYALVSVWAELELPRERPEILDSHWQIIEGR